VVIDLSGCSIRPDLDPRLLSRNATALGRLTRCRRTCLPGCLENCLPILARIVSEAPRPTQTALAFYGVTVGCGGFDTEQ
jgi:hypothetical protein